MKRLVLLALLLSLPSFSYAGVSLDRANAEFLESSDANLILNPPFLVIGWGRCSSCTSGQHTLASMMTNGDNGNGHKLVFHGDSAGDPVAVQSQQGAGSQAQAVTTTGYVATTWYHAAMYAVSASDRRAYINGGSKGTNTTSVTPNTMNRFYIGKKGTSNYFNGYVAAVAVYDCTGATTAAVEADIALAAGGDNPTTLTACTLIEYWPLLTNAQGQCNNIDFTEQGTITYDSGTHPTVDAFVSCPGEFLGSINWASILRR